MPLLILRPLSSAESPPSPQVPATAGVETSFTWANLLREAKMPSGVDDVGMGVPPEIPPSQKGNLY